MKRPFETWILFILLVLLAANAFYGGISFILEPDGSLLKINPEWLERSPFTNYLIPGILLILFYNRNKSYSVIKLIRRHDKF
jgi:hypothetical protein